MKLFRSMAGVGCVVLASVGVSGCRATTPSPTNLEERATDLLTRAQELSSQGGDPLLSAVEEKRLREDAIRLVLEQANSELRYVGLASYPEAAERTLKWLDLAKNLIGMPQDVFEAEWKLKFKATSAANDFFSTWFWADQGRSEYTGSQTGDLTIAVCTHILMGLVGPYVIWGATDTVTAAVDLFTGWTHEKKPGPQGTYCSSCGGRHGHTHEAAATTYQVELDPALTAREQALRAELDEKVRAGEVAPESLAQAGARDQTLALTFSYDLSSEDAAKADEYRKIANRRAVPGEAQVGVWPFTHRVDVQHYQRLWDAFSSEVKEWLRAENRGGLLGSRIVQVRDHESKIRITVRQTVLLPVPHQLPFTDWVRNHEKNGDEDILFNVEMPE